ncbi:uncharacterized protein LOC123685008 [Harmonia axyridis]|uniref:uncharacterized protein LOC123685008 n=1 Tax=Harmonia axyridis TaxID=115357 RepID=UPI001E278E3E|nr:uncharacterized protein LOC123685008 [Harmonia axyridis]
MAEDAGRNIGGEDIDDRRERLRNVRRRLDFGQDHSQQKEEDEAALGVVQNDFNAASAKWNFDFANEVPLEGDWEWEKVEDRQEQDYKGLTIVKEIKKTIDARSI